MNTRPNILWYCTDQQRFDTIGALGNQNVVTPTIDSIVENGVAFTHAYCQSPICTPSRSSFMTGMYPSRVHNTRNGNDTFPDYPPVITKLIADAGYDCGLIGKFHLRSAGHRTEPRLMTGFRTGNSRTRRGTTGARATITQNGFAKKAATWMRCARALNGLIRRCTRQHGRPIAPSTLSNMIARQTSLGC